MITNKYNLPDVFIQIASKQYKGSENYSASMLNKAVRQIWLERRHRDEVEVDVIDTLWALMGSAVHSVLDKGQEKDALTEQYIKTEIAGKYFVGMADHYKDGVISDYKFTTVWSYIYMKKSDHQLQLNAYKYLYESLGFEVKKLQIVFIFRDWNKNKVDNNYPPAPVMTVDIPFMDNMEEIIKSKISLCEQYRDTPDNELPFCNDEERWAKPSAWAVMKEGRKTAIRVLESQEECLSYIFTNNLDNNHFVEERKGNQYVRCDYCSGKQFCNQYQEGL